MWMGKTTADAEDDLDADAYPMALGSLGKKLAIALGVTLFWCGITSVFAYSVIGSMVRHQFAALRFASTEGVVLSSKIKTSSDSESGSTHAPRIKYRYMVAGREYIGQRYDFASMSSSDGSYAQRAVSENPPGKAVTVYYDPSNPSEAILHLEAPGSSYFLLLFLQPFLLVGLALIGWCATLPFTHSRLKKVLSLRRNAAVECPRLGCDGTRFRRAGPARTAEPVCAAGPLRRRLRTDLLPFDLRGRVPLPRIRRCQRRRDPLGRSLSRGAWELRPC